MRVNTITDLDSMLLKVRNAASQMYIREAIAAFRTGAFRAAIISTWIAVSFDIISKLKELTLYGDSNAKEHIEKLQINIKHQNIKKLQEFEEDILRVAYEQFEFFDYHEFEDLNRLKHDRNLCAHPAFAKEEVLFQPSPELVRTHIVHSITHLLKNQPVQGKSAIGHILNDIKSNIFPKDIDDSCRYLSEKYLNRAKNVLVRNLLIVILKEYFSDIDEFDSKKLNSIIAISRTHHKIYNSVLKEKLAPIISSESDKNFEKIFSLLALDEEIWSIIEEPIKIKIKAFIQSLSVDNFDLIIENYIFKCLEIPDVTEHLLSLFNVLPSKDQAIIISTAPNAKLANQAVELYGKAGAYRHAEDLGEKVLLPIAPFLNDAQIVQILNFAKDNGQINYAGGTPEILCRFFKITRNHIIHTKDAWIDFVKKMLETNDPKGYYGYPELQKLMRGEGIEI